MRKYSRKYQILLNSFFKNFQENKFYKKCFRDVAPRSIVQNILQLTAAVQGWKSFAWKLWKFIFFFQKIVSWSLGSFWSFWNFKEFSDLIFLTVVIPCVLWQLCNFMFDRQRWQVVLIIKQLALKLKWFSEFNLLTVLEINQSIHLEIIPSKELRRVPFPFLGEIWDFARLYLAELLINLATQQPTKQQAPGKRIKFSLSVCLWALQSFARNKTDKKICDIFKQQEKF